MNRSVFVQISARQHLTMLTHGIITILTIVTVVLADDIVKVKQGSLRGYRLTSRKGREIFAFQGIPYAKPPVGDLRFKAPQQPDPWTGVLDATKEGSMCLQGGSQSTDVDVRGSEDCLFLNVYTPKLPTNADDEEPLDVMFWIHGGGFYAGSGNADLYGPQYLLDKDVILVTINYRLGALGFLSTGDAACPGNNGLKDQVAALRWVRDNIAAFGGNPNSVTIFGQSAGGASVHHHVLSPMSKGLFHQAISQSGAANCPWAFATHGSTKNYMEKIANEFDCPTKPSEDFISCLLKQDSGKIINLDAVITGTHDYAIVFQPVLESEVGDGDEAFLKESPIQRLLSDDLELVPWMVGLTEDEGGLFQGLFVGDKEIDMGNSPLVISYLNNPEDKNDRDKVAKSVNEFYFNNETLRPPLDNDSLNALIKFSGDSFIFAGINTAARLHSKRGATVYYYVFDYRGTNSFSSVFLNTTEDLGVVHVDDIIYLFPQNASFPGTKTSPEDEHMIDFMTTLWVNFTQRGNPTPSWDTVSSPDVLEFERIQLQGLQRGKGPFSDRAKFWDSLPVKSRYPTVATKDEV